MKTKLCLILLSLVLLSVSCGKKIDPHEAEIADLKARLDSLQVQVAVGSLTADNTALAADNAALVAENTILQTEAALTRVRLLEAVVELAPREPVNTTTETETTITWTNTNQEEVDWSWAGGEGIGGWCLPPDFGRRLNPNWEWPYAPPPWRDY